MIDLEILKEYGVSADELKKILAPEKGSKDKNEKVAKLKARIKSRINEGVHKSMENWKVYHALDVAWDTPFRQVSATLIQSMMDKDPETDKSVESNLASLGLTHLLVEEQDPKTKKQIKKINVPAFFNIFVPIVKSYMTIRWAKIMNERRQNPYLKYEPAISTLLNRLRCELTTQRIEVMSRQYGYYEVQKKSVFNMLHYGVALKFPKEEWHTEHQLVRDEKGSVPTGKTTKVSAKRTREGLRHHIPHPTRTFYDQAHPLPSFNTDSGCEFAGYWRIMRYGALQGSGFYNTDKISIGQTEWYSKNQGYFANVYPCVMQFPTRATEGAGKNDRETKLQDQFYSNSDSDKAVLVTEYYEKLVPKDYGLGEYEYPVWFRFVVASDDTILYAAPLPYAPVVYYGYDADEGRDLNASMSLEMIPFQDQFSNLLSQYVLSCKQNLTNLTMIDENLIPEGTLEKLKGWGENFFRKRNFLGFDGRKMMKAQQSANQAMISHHFPQLDTASIVSAMKIVLDTMERTLVMSAQELAQAASHEQTREEVRNIAQSTSTRVVFTTTPVDIATEAWKKQLYCAWQAYGEEDFMGSVPMEQDVTKEKLKEMGFTYVDEYVDPSTGNVMAVVTGNKAAINIEAFASSRDGNDRINNVESAQMMATFMRDLLTNPITGPAIGPEQALKAANMIAQFAGFPRDFTLRAVPGSSPQEQQAEQMGQIKQMMDQMQVQFQEMLGAELKPIAEKIVEHDAKFQELMAILGNTPAAPPDQYDTTTPGTVDPEAAAVIAEVAEAAGSADPLAMPPIPGGFK